MLKHDFLCVGFAKCGTTTLYHILSQHKDIYLPAIKEPYFYYSKGYEWYINRYYDQTTDKKIVGEINPAIAMAVSSKTPSQIAKRLYDDFGKDIKLIFIMRNPVDKLFSWYACALEYGWIYEKPADNVLKGKTFSQGFAEYIEGRFIHDENMENVQLNLGENPRVYYELEGNYHEFITGMLEYFPMEQMKFVILEELIKDPDGTFKDIIDFLGIEEDPSLDYKQRANEGDRCAGSALSVILTKAWKRIMLLYHKNGKFRSYERCRRMMEFDLKMEKLLSVPRKDFTKMPPETRTLLQNYYRDDKNKLAELLGKDLNKLWFE